MKLYYLIILIIIQFLYSVKGNAQNTKYALKGYIEVHYNEESGLGQNSVKGICLGSNGQLCVVTETGLVEYDGQKFFRLTSDQTGLSGDHMGYAVRYGQHGYVVSSKFEYAEVSRHPIKKIPTGELIYISPDSSVFPKNFPLIYPRFKFAQAIDDYSNNIPNIFIEGYDGLHYFIYQDSILYGISQKTIRWKKNVGTKPFRFAASGGNILLYHYNDDLEVINEKGKSKIIHVDSVVKIIWNTVSKQIFVESEKEGLLMMDKNMEPKMILPQLPPDFTFHFAQYLAPIQTVFLGSFTRGLLVYKKNRFHTSEVPWPDQCIYSVTPYRDTALLSARGYILYKQGKATPLTPAFPAFEHEGRTMGFSPKQHYTIWHDFKISTYTVHGQKISEKPSMRCGLIYNDGDSLQWVGLLSGEIVKSNGKTSTTISFPPHVICMMPLGHSHMLIGATSGCYLLDRKSSRYLLIPGTEDILIRSLFRSSKGNYYATTDMDGIFRLTQNGIHKIPLDPHDNLSTAHCIVEDAYNRFWITGNRGLYCIPEHDLLTQTPNLNGHIFYYFFGKENGFLSNEFNGACTPCGNRLKNGEVVFPNMQGLVWFNPDSIPLYFPQFKLELKKAVLNETNKLPIGDTLWLPQEFRRFELYLSTPFYGHPNNIFLEYTMGGPENQGMWTQTDILQPLVFNYLPAGYNHITFRVRKKFGDDAFTYLYLTYYRQPKLWEYSLFYPILILLSIIIFYILYFLRTKNLQRKNEILQKAVYEGKKAIQESYDLLEMKNGELKNKTRFQNWLITSLIHDLRGPLRLIKNYGQLFEEQNQLEEKGISFLKSVFEMTKGIYSYSEQLLQLLKLQQKPELLPENTNFAQVLKDRLDNYKKELELKNINVITEMDKDSHMYINSAALSIILQNLLDNTIKLQDTGTIYIRYTRTHGKVYVEIQDEGPGLPKHMLPKLNAYHLALTEDYPEEGGLGMWLVFSMLEKTKGKIKFENNIQGLHILLEWQDEMPTA